MSDKTSNILSKFHQEVRVYINEIARVGYFCSDSSKFTVPDFRADNFFVDCFGNKWLYKDYVPLISASGDWIPKSPDFLRKHLISIALELDKHGNLNGNFVLKSNIGATLSRYSYPILECAALELVSSEWSPSEDGYLMCKGSELGDTCRARFPMPLAAYYKVLLPEMHKKLFTQICSALGLGPNHEVFNKKIKPIKYDGKLFLSRSILYNSLGVTICDKNPDNPNIQNDCSCIECIDYYEGKKLDFARKRGSYHSLPRINRSLGETIKAGFEIEKEDLKVLSKYNAKTIFTEYGWCLEEDSSLDNQSGFELISPVLPLMNDEVLSVAFNNVLELINAKTSNRCGGHIHISEVGSSTIELYRSISGYTALIYALEFERVSKGNGGNAVSKNEINRQSGHRDKFAVKSNTLEIRAFDSPKNIDILWGRVRLLQYMMRNRQADDLAMFVELTNPDSELSSIVRTINDKYTYGQIVEYTAQMMCRFCDVKQSAIPSYSHLITA